jgi:uncharacterized phiE125 gp8 family phage protein
MTRTLITGPAEPITLADAKLHMRGVDHADEDTLITSLITAAREAAEHELGRPLASQEWQITLDAFPAAELALGPDVASIASIQYLDGAGALQTLDAAAYVLDNYDAERCYLLPADGVDWPSTYDSANAVRVRITCGLTPVPESVRSWMLMQLGTLYKHREAVAAGVPVAELPGRFVDRLLDRYRIWG